MKVKDAIKLLSELNPDNDIVIVWWDEDSFNPDDVTDENWAKLVSMIDNEMDWSHDQDIMEDMIIRELSK